MLPSKKMFIAQNIIFLFFFREYHRKKVTLIHQLNSCLLK